MQDAVQEIDWTAQLVEQLDWHWQHQLRPRLDGMSDGEYTWEPVEGCWSVRPRGSSSAPVQAGSGAYTIDFAIPEPVPAPVTTIAWRLGHLLVGVLGARLAAHFAGEPADYFSYDYPGTASEALVRLDTLRGMDGGRALAGRRGARPAVRGGRGRVRRPADGRAGAAHQP